MTKRVGKEQTASAESTCHLSDEEVALWAGGEVLDSGLAVHLGQCEQCTERAQVAESIISVDPISHEPDPRRLQLLLDRLCAVGAVPPGEGRGAVIKIGLGQNQIDVIHTDTEVRIRRAVATRSIEPGVELPGVAFFRHLGDIDVEIHIIQSAGSRFHLVAGLAQDGKGVSDFRVALHKGVRQLAVEPAPYGTATFKSLRPSSYVLEVRKGTSTLGFVEIDVEERDGREVPE